MRRKKIPFFNLWEKELVKTLGRGDTDALAVRFQDEYSELVANHRKILPRALRTHLRGNIFPQMAVYKVLRRTEMAEEDVMECIEKLHVLTLKKQKKQFEDMAKKPYAFMFARIFIPLIMKFQFPAAGWTNEWIENSRDCISIKVHSCFYRDTLKEYNVPELLSIYCNGDDYVFGDQNLPYIRWGRTVTMSRGADYCDVIYHNNARKKGHRNEPARDH